MPVGPRAARRTSLSGWGGTAPTIADVHRPLTDEHVRQLLAAAGPRGALARGLGRSYGDAAQNGGGSVLDVTGLRNVLRADLDTGVVTVGAGVSIGDLIRWFLPHGWFPAVVPGTQHVTVGGAIAADIHGKNHHGEGAWGRHVLDLRLATPVGTMRVGPDEEPDVFAATTGGMGLTGVALEATLQLKAVETPAIRVEELRTPDLDGAIERLAAEDQDHTYSVAWVDCSSPDARGRCVLSRGEHARTDELPTDSSYPSPAPTGWVSLPSWWRWRVLNPAVLRGFNEAWYRRAPAEPRTSIVPLGRFFFPLDAVGGWNRLYGSAGFIQYQFVVPPERDDVLRRIVEESSRQATVLLAVLKRFGAAGPGPLSFPIPGWTLALDIPVGAPGLAPLLDRWDEAVAAAGGRVYLAKDARMRAGVPRAMYPELTGWQRIRAKLDPERRLCSDLARRLGLATDDGDIEA